MTGLRHGIAQSDNWATAIGRSIIAFARIEHAATLLVRQCTPDAVGHRAARLDLSARLAYIDRLLCDSGLTTQEGRRWSHIFRKIEALREQHRTILAYGAPLPGPIEFTGRFVIVREAHGPRQSLLTLAQIEQAAEEIGAVHAEFVQAATEILTRLAAEDRLPLPAAPTTPDTARRAAGTSRPNTHLLLAPPDRPAPVIRPQGGKLAGSGGG
jgi:hypothetical protein